MAAFRTLRNRFAHSKTLRAIPNILKRLLLQAAKWLRPGRTGMNNTIAVNMTEAVTCLTTAILCAVLLLTGGHDLPEEKIMYLHLRELTSTFDEAFPSLPECFKILPAGQLFCRIIVEAITDMRVWQLKLGNLLLATKAQKFRDIIEIFT